jgi:lysophospholipase L1-like esterase
MKATQSIKRLSSGQPFRLDAIGDSLTSGWMVNKGYVRFLEEMLKHRYPDAPIEVNSFGVPGDTAKGGMMRLNNHLLRYDPNAIMIQFGLNDMVLGFSAYEYQLHIDSMIQTIREKPTIEIILVSSVCFNSPRENADINPYYDKLDILSKTYFLSFAKVHEYWRTNIDGGTPYNNIVMDDMVHPTEKGYELMAEAIMKLFY